MLLVNAAGPYPFLLSLVLGGYSGVKSREAQHRIHIEPTAV
jgi:hypothetical protein